MAGQVDLYHWEQDNLTDLCTPSCLASSSDWAENVYNVCDGQSVTTDSKMVPADGVALRYSDGISLACLTVVYACVHECRVERPSRPSIIFFDNRILGSVRTQVQLFRQSQSVKLQQVQQLQILALGMGLPLNTTTRQLSTASWSLKPGRELISGHWIAL